MTQNAGLSARLHSFLMRLFRTRTRNAITENAKELAALGRRMEERKANTGEKSNASR